MPKFEITKDNFDKLLRWLNEDRERAAQTYSLIHRKLVVFFTSKQISVAQDLADEAINRVARKIDHLTEDYKGDPAYYFFSVAKKVLLEYLKSPKELELSQVQTAPEQEKDVFEDYYEHFYSCMENLSVENRELIIKYFQKAKQSKIDHHKELMKKLEISPQLLRTKIFRIKNSLRKCIKSNLEKKNV